MQSLRAALTCLAVASLTAGKAWAGPSPAEPSPPPDPCAGLSSLVTRPTVTTAPCVVKRATLLLETGYTNATTSGSSDASTINVPQADLRVGLGHNLEFEFNPASYERTSGRPQTGGYTDSVLGFKAELGYTSRFVYGASVAYTLNSGSDAFSGHGDGVLLDANATYAASPAIGIFSSFGYNAQSGGTLFAPQRYHNLAPSLGISVALPQSFNLFAEGFGQTSTGPGSTGRYGGGVGLTRDVGPRLQLDVEVYDGGFNGGQHVHSAGFGAAYLIGS